MLVGEADERLAIAPAGHRVGLETRTYSPLVAATPAFTFAAKERATGLATTRTPSGTSPTLPGTLATTSSSSTCRASAGSDRQLARVAVRDDDRRPSSERFPVGRERPLRSRVPAERLDALEPGRDEALAVLERPRDALDELVLADEDRGIPRDLARCGLVDRDDRNPQAMASSTGRPKPSKRDGCTRQAAPW